METAELAWIVLVFNAHYVDIWWFPKIVVAPNHPFQWDFLYKPTILRYTHDCGTPYIHTIHSSSSIPSAPGRPIYGPVHL